MMNRAGWGRLLLISGHQLAVPNHHRQLTLSESLIELLAELFGCLHRARSYHNIRQ